MAQDGTVMLEYTYFRADFPDFCEKPLDDNSLFATLRKRYKLEVVSVEQEVTAIHADAIKARLLEVHLNSPVIHIYRRYHTNDKGFLFTVLFFATPTSIRSVMFSINRIPELISQRFVSHRYQLYPGTAFPTIKKFTTNLVYTSLFFIFGLNKTNILAISK